MHRRLTLSFASIFRSKTTFILLIILLAGLSACAPAAPMPMPEEVTVIKEVEVENRVEVQQEADRSRETHLTNLPAAEGLTGPANQPGRFKRLIIKNAELEIVVQETDSAIDRSMGIVQEFEGYVISNRTWQQADLKYATLSIGVPADHFEDMVRRLKGLAVEVRHEIISGQDVTDQYVDLDSRLKNLEATASRIRHFLKEAEDVETALEVSNKLSEVEEEIELVKGRMTYLSERAAFSTITLQMVPEPLEAPASGWSAGRVLGDAWDSATAAARGLFEFTVTAIIWLGVVILPYLLLILGGVWAVYRLIRRRAGTMGPSSNV